MANKSSVINPLVQDIYSLTPLQEGMLYHNISEENSTSYVMQNLFRLSGKIDEECIKMALMLLTQKHEALRTMIGYEKMTEPRQIVLKKRPPEYEHISLVHLSNQEERLNQIIEEDVKRGFHLQKDTLIRVKYIEMNSNDIRMLWSFHHIIVDGWCISIIFQDFIQLYEQLMNHKSYSELENSIQEKALMTPKYGAYIKWLKEQNEEQSLSYWRDLLKGYDEIADIKPIRKVEMSQTRTQSIHGEISEKSYSELKRAASSQKVTPNTIMEAAWGILLQRYNHSNDIVFGKVVSGRTAKVYGIESMVGLFINTIPIRVHSQENSSVGDLLRSLQGQALQSEEYSYCSLAKIQNMTEQKGELIKTLLAFENYLLEDDWCKSANGIIELTEQYGREETNYDICLTISPDKAGLNLDIMYNAFRYAKEDVQSILDLFQRLLTSIVSHMDCIPSELEWIDKKDRNLILNVFNQTSTDYPKNQSLVSLFEEQVANHYDHIAVVMGERKISYGQLDHLSDAIALRLQQMGVHRCDMVMIYAQRSIQMIAGILGILKAGGAYVPIDINYPLSRIQYMIEDCKPKAILLYQCEIETSYHTFDLSESFETMDTQFNKPELSGDDLCYMIYTSGTTGKPKGNMIEHKSVSRLVKNTNYIELNDTSVILQTGSMAFDASTLEVWGALLNGGTLVLVSQDILLDTQWLKNEIQRNKCTIMWLTAALFNQVISTDVTTFDSLKHLLIGGEKLSEMHVRLLKEHNNSLRLTNGYGPTENTTFTTTYDIPRQFDHIPIGKPISNTVVYIMDQNKLCPVGIPGELMIGGEGLSRGYFNLPDLTEKKFVSNPFGEGKLYASGDLGRWLPDGTIEFLGRIDQQVKIRGFRIELQEIQSVLCEMSDIKDAAVVVHEESENEKMIWAYIVSDSVIDIPHLKEMMHEKLPQYMIPSFMLQLERIPVTENGKVDYRQLPEIERTSMESYEAPRNSVEEALCRVFCNVLNCERVGINDSFYDLGGDSIKAIRIVSGIKKEGYQATVKDIMNQYTVKGIASTILLQNEEQEPEIEEIVGKVPTTPIVRDFLSWNLVTPNHFNQDFLIPIDNDIKTEKLRSILTTITDHHSMLRCVLRENTLVILDQSDNIGYELFEYRIDNGTEQEMKDIIQEKANVIQKSINLEQGPLTKAALFVTQDQSYFFWCFHHLVIDAVSIQIIMEDFETLIQQSKQGQELKLPKKTASYITWANTLKEFAETKRVQSQLPYWQKALQNSERGKLNYIQRAQNGIAASLEWKLSKEKTADLRYRVNQVYSTNSMEILLSAVAIALRKCFNQQYISIQLERHGRESLHKSVEIDRTVGWFTSIYPVILPCEYDIRQSIITTKETLRHVPDNGLTYGLLEEKLPKVETDIQFNYLGEIDGAMENMKFCETGMNIAPENDIKTVLLINSVINSGELTVSISYDTARIDEKKVQSVSDMIQETVEEIIEYCLQAQKKEKTPSDFSDVTLTMEEFEAINRQVSYEVEDIYKLSPMQDGMLFHHMMEPESTAYYIQNVLHLSGMISSDQIQKALELVNLKYDVLRCVIIKDELEQPRQVVLNRPIEFRYWNLIDQEKESQKKFVDSIKEQDLKRGYQLDQDNLYRCYLVITGENEADLIWCIHHIIVDGWSLTLIYKDFMAFYERLCDGISFDKLQHEISLSAKKNAFSRYISLLQSMDKEISRNYWKALLEDYEEVATIKPIYKNTSSDNQMEQSSFSASKDMTRQVAEILKMNHLTMNIFTEVIWGLTLQEYNNTQDIVFGKVVAGRDPLVTDIDEMVGPFLNTVPVRVKTSGDMTLIDIMRNQQKQAIESEKYYDLSLSEIQSMTLVKNNLIHTIYAFENYYGSDREFDQHKWVDCKLVDSREQTNYAISLAIHIEEEQLSLYLMYDPRIYVKEEIDLILKRMQNIMEQFVLEPELHRDMLSHCVDGEIDKILNTFNNTTYDYPQNMTIVDLLEQRAEEEPESIALIEENRKVTYKELNQSANLFAYRLRDIGVKPNEIVAVYAKRTINTVIAIFGVIKSGAAYLPIDVTFPRERIEFMLQDSGAKIILSDADIDEPKRSILKIEDILKDNQDSTKNPERVNKPTDLAYVIYTSGTTGKPKGVMLEHKGVVNLSAFTKQRYEITKKDHVLQFANFVFDASVWEFSMSILNGTSLVIATDQIIRNSDLFEKYLKENEVTVATLPPNYYRQLNSIELRVIITAGSESSQDILLKAGNCGKYINAYGPTEITVCATDWEHVEQPYNMIPIGKPITNMRVYIVKNNKLCGVGIPGEICIGGVGVARGYLNLEKLTTEKFINNPWGQGKLYRSGDLGRWLPDGNVEYLGRADEQVKIRGFRIELGEIENALRKLPGIKEAIAMVRKSNQGDKSIYAYLIAKQEITTNEIRTKLRESLPDYMIPSYFFFVEEIPVTRSGKIDKNKLPVVLDRDKKEYSKPTSQPEEVLCKAFEEVLEVERVGITDSFYELGGDSIKALRIVSHVRKQKYQLSVRDIMQFSSVRQIASSMTKVDERKIQSKEANNGPVLMTPILRRFQLWKLNQPQYFNQDVRFTLKKEVTIKQLQEVLSVLIKHHDILRAVYRDNTLFIRAEVDDTELSIHSYDLKEMNSEEYESKVQEISTTLQGNLNLEQGPMMQMALFQSENKNQFFWCIHHLLVDYVSWSILLEDFRTTLQQMEERQEIHLPDKTTSYCQWAQLLYQQKDNPYYQNQKEYWKTYCQAVSQTSLESIQSDQEADLGRYNELELMISRELVVPMKEQASEIFNMKMNEVLISALVISLFRITNETNTALWIEGHGRYEIAPEVALDRTIGWFTNIYPISFLKQDGLENQLVEIKEKLHKVPDVGIGYAIYSDELPVTENDVIFNYLESFQEKSSDNQIEFCTTGKSTSDENIMGKSIIINALDSVKGINISVAYPGNLYMEDVMKQLLQYWESALNDIYELCLVRNVPCKTPSDYSAKELSMKELQQITQQGVDLMNVEEIHYLTGLQEGMLYHHVENENSSSYIIQDVFELTGSWNIGCVKEAILNLSRNFDALRIQLMYKKMNRPLQIIYANREIEIKTYDLSKLSELQQEEKTAEIIHQDIARGFALEADSLFRVTYLILTESKAQMIWTFHHSIVDGWCITLLFGEFLKNYHFAVNNGGDIKEYGKKKEGFSDYLTWYSKQDTAQGLRYWKSLLDDYSEIASVPQLYENKCDTDLSQEYQMTVPSKLCEHLIRKASSMNITVSMFLEAALGILLQKLNYIDDVVFGKVVSGRNVDIPGIESMVGLFVNTIPVRIKAAKDSSISELLQSVKEQSISSQEFSYISLTDIQALTDQKSDLIQVLFAFENYYVNENALVMESDDLSYQIKATREETNYNITIAAYLEDNQLVMKVLYHTKMYEESDIEQLMQRYLLILDEILQDDNRQVREIKTITEQEISYISEINETLTDISLDQSVLDKFEEFAQHSPEKAAIIYQGKNITYRELDQKSNQLANYLSIYDINREDCIAILSRRRIDIVIAFLAILKTGGAYVPIDPQYPQERIQFILNDCKPKVLLVDEKSFDAKMPVITLSEIQDKLQTQPDILRNKVKVTANQLSYIIYTSGTTGKPKGNLIEQKSIMRLIQNINYTVLNEETVIMQTGSMAFDASTFEVWGSLGNGGTLVLADEDEIIDAYKLKKILRDNKVNTMFMTTALFNQMIGTDIEVFDGLSHLMIGGEKLSENHVRSLREHDQNFRFSNIYGPTENTTFSTWYDIPVGFTRLPIGKPITNTTAYIIENNNLCGIGIPGELCLGGLGISRGYLNRKELSKQKFIPNPYGEGKLYCTGDLVRWLPDGNIDFLGRIDQQVKLRGFRIELTEIENVFEKISPIKKAVVVLKTETNGDKALSAYLTSDTEIDLRDVKQQLQKLLPVYMVPAYMMQISEIPMNRSGKIDKSKLPVIEKKSQHEYLAPSTPEEQLLCSICEEVLDVALIGLEDNFFELGGDSIKAIRIVSNLRNYGYGLSVKDIMKLYIIGEIAKVITSYKEEDISQDEVTGDVKDTPIITQFKKWNLQYPNEFIQDILMELPKKITTEQLQKIVTKLRIHHDILRAAYRDGHLTILSSNEMKKVSVLEYDVSDEIEKQENEIQNICREDIKRISLEDGIVITASIIKIAQNQRIHLVINHLVMDGVSWRILIEDIKTLLKQIYTDETLALPKKTLSYQEWANKLIEYRNSPILNEQMEYWKTTNELMKDSMLNVREGKKQNGVGILQFELSSEETRMLLQDTNKPYFTSVNDVLLAALSKAVFEMTGQKGISVMFEGHGREELHKKFSVDRTIGWFTSQYPVILPCCNDVDDCLIETKEALRRVPNRGIGYGVVRNELNSYNAVILFNYLGEVSEESSEFRVEFFPTEFKEHIAMDEPIQLNGKIENKKFIQYMSFDGNQFDQENMEQLMIRYKENLIRLMEYCSQYKQSKRTASDYTTKRLMRTDVEHIQKKYESDSNIQDIYSLTPLQAGMLFHNIANPKSSAYIIQHRYEMEGNILPDRIREAFELLTDRYDVLRTKFVFDKLTEPMQVVLRNPTVDYEYMDLSGMNDDAIANYVQQVEEEQLRRGFSLSEDAVIRMRVLQTSDHTAKLILSLHHIVVDGWSYSKILGGFLTYYQYLMTGRTPDEARMQIQKQKNLLPEYRDYIRWIENLNQQSAMKYWTDLLQDYDNVVEIKPMLHPETTTKQESRITKTVSNIQYEKLNRMASTYNITVNTILETSWAFVLAMINHTDDVVFGKVVSGRNIELKGIDEVVGLFVNTIPVRIQFDSNKKIYEILQEVQEQGNESNQYCFCSLAEIQNCTNVKSDLIKVIYAFENYYIDETLLNKESVIHLHEETSKEQTNYAISVAIYENEKQLNICISYNPSEFVENEIDVVITRLQYVIDQMLEHATDSIQVIDAILLEEKNKIMHEFNATETAYNEQMTAVDLFEQNVDRNPQQPAVILDDEMITYQDLNGRANRLAHKLNEMGIGKEDYVVVLCERSFEMIIAIIGIIKSGAAYVPIDPHYPKDRIEYMIQDCNAKAVITYKASIEMDVQVIDLTEDIVQESKEIVTHNPQHRNQPEDVCYVIYTSGTTGKPKGVMVMHHGVVNMQHYLQRLYQIEPDDHVLQFSNIIFDASVWELTMSLFSGATLVLVRSEIISDMKAFENYVASKKITITLLPPQYYYQSNLPCLKVLTTGGSATNKEIAMKAKEHTRYINAYGPTENTVLATHWENNEQVDYDCIPIGKPIDNSQIYILNKDKLCGVGIPGELCICGDGLAKGYLNLPELTHEKFKTNPFGKGRIYHSGDLARWLPDGNIEYLGRIDQQVKIRGFRIELGDIENALLGINQINDAVVLAKMSVQKEQILCAYVVSDEKIVSDDIKNKLGETLPNYMIPSFIIQMDQIPVTKSGKVDKKSLPDIKELLENRGTEIVAARNQYEQNLYKIWCEVLNLEQISIYDNFFDVGGNSIKVITLISKIQEIYPDVVKVGDVFANPKIAQLAEFIERSNSKSMIWKPIQLPEQIFMKQNGTMNHKQIKFTQESPMYHEIKQRKLTGELDDWALLIFAQAFLMKTISEQKQFELYTVVSDKYMVITVNWTENIDFNEVYADIKAQCSNAEKYPYINIKRDMSIQGILPVLIIDSKPKTEYEYVADYTISSQMDNTCLTFTLDILNSMIGSVYLADLFEKLIAIIEQIIS